MRYFIVTYLQKPDGRFNEVAKLDDKIRNRDLVMASVILDYRQRQVKKSRFQGEIGDPKDFDTISNFYKEHYPDIINALEAKYQVLEELLEEIKENAAADETD